MGYRRNACIKEELQWRNVFCLRAFLTFADLVSDFLAFCQGNTAVTGAVYLTKMYEHILAAVVLLDKSVAFFIVEPFNGSV